MPYCTRLISGGAQSLTQQIFAWEVGSSFCLGSADAPLQKLLVATLRWGGSNDPFNSQFSDVIAKVALNF